MNRNYFLLISLVLSNLFAIGQDFSYKQISNQTLTKLKYVVLSDLPEPSGDLVPVAAPAPKPFTNADLVKRELDQSRKRKFNNSLHKYQQTPEDVTPEVPNTFDGLPIGGAGIPNDNNMAISNDGMVISVINSSITIFSETGERLLYRSLSGIVGGALPNLDRTYDPKVVYDPDNERFILVFLQGSTSKDTRIIVGFSETKDPTKAWNFYAITGNPFGGKTWSDYPIIGISKEDLYITVNILVDDGSWQTGFIQSVIWQVNKNSGYSGADSVFQNVFYDIKYDDKSIWSICAAPGGLAPSGPGMHFLSVRPGDASNDTLFLHEIDNTQQSGIAKYSLKVLKTSKPYGVPPSAFQPDASNTLQTNDARVLSAMEHNGIIQYVQTSLIPENGGSGVFHGLIDLETQTIENNYISSDTFDYAYPSIAFSGDEAHPYSSVITFSHTSEIHFPGTSVIFHNKIKGSESLYSNVALLKAGEAIINRLMDSTNERWGDYTGIQRRYNGVGEVWASGSFGRKVDKNSVWIGQVKVNNQLNTIDKVNSMVLLPNPAVTSAIARISLEQQEALSFVLFNSIGQMVFELDSKLVEAGSYEFVLNTAAYRSGIYELVAYRKNGDVFTRTKVLIQ